MSTRILREPNGQPARPIPGRGGVIRLRSHACGRSCPRHDAPVPVPPKAPGKKRKGKRRA